ncbi:phage holin family protein [Ancylobacter sp.]|uniref:phage holin family protein n=1 Tax=Ancylobacter sp. TaxID=1872567 RepID=UPI003BABD1E9
MLRLLLAIFGAEIRLTMRRAVRTALLCAIGGLLVAMSAVFFLIASFIALADRYDALTAALIIGGGLLALGVIFLLVALMRRQRRPVGFGGYGAYGAYAAPPAAPIVPPAAPLAGGPAVPPAGVKTVLGIAAGAALIGLILGRRV